MIVITVGKSYIDIDGYASSIAYRELLKQQGIDAKFVSNAVLNYSITESLLNIPFHVDKYEINPVDEFIVLDISNKEFFPKFVVEDSIIEVIDHHPGYEEYWNSKLKEKSIIDQIGAVATIIFEKYEEANLICRLDVSVAKLLMAAILDNTLNFTAKITTDRDINAYKKLEKITGCYNFRDIYFGECLDSICTNLRESIVNDIKIQKTNEYLPEVIGQLTIWDINKILDKIDTIKGIMNDNGRNWIINIISLKDNKSYILYSNDSVKENFIKLFNCNIENEMIILNKSMLRKEIIRTALEK